MKEMENLDSQIIAQNFFAYCKYEKRLSDVTLRAYRLDVAHFTKFLQSMQADVLPGGLAKHPAPPPEVDFTTVTKETLQKYLHALSEQYKVKTVKRRFACLRSFYNYLEYQEMITANPFLKFKLNMKDSFTLPTSMSLTEMDKMLQAVHQLHVSSNVGFSKNQFAPNSFHFIKLRDVTILEFLFASGVRVSELCGLRLDDLYDDYTVLRIMGKGNKERLVYLVNPEVIQIFQTYLQFRAKTGTSCEYVFINKEGKKLSTQAVRNLVAKYVNVCGISKNITPHAFRHTFASLLLEEGVDIKYIQEFLGHSSITTTQIYLHTSTQRKKDIIFSKHPRQKLSLGAE